MDLNAVNFNDLINAEYKQFGKKGPITPIGYALALTLLEEAGLDPVLIETMRWDDGKEATREFIAKLRAMSKSYMRRVKMREGGEIPPRPTGWGSVVAAGSWDEMYGEEP